MAYGPLALTPEQFWALTHCEFVLLCEGYKERAKVARGRDAWMLANILQPHYKNQLKPKMFLGEGGGTGNQGWTKITPEEYQAIMKRKREAAEHG